MAREGVTVEREPRPIHISALRSAVMLPDALKPPGYNPELPDWCSSIDTTRVIGVGFALSASLHFHSHPTLSPLPLSLVSLS